MYLHMIYPWIDCGIGLIVFTILRLPSIFSFNLDSRVPILKTGPSDSYFGFSIAHHFINEDGPARSVLIVGAPRDNVSNSEFVEPGAVYRCPISFQPNDCDQLRIDRSSSLDSDKSNQWLGVSVTSQNSPEGTAIACAHRFKKRGPAFVWGQGICFKMSNILDEIDTLEPCSGRPTLGGHQEYGFCQAGANVAINKNGDVLMGAPGSVGWRGSLFEIIANTLEDVTKFETNSTNFIKYYSYLGTSVKIGSRIFESGQLAYVGGAPNSEGSGEVFIFRRNVVNETLDPVLRLKGDQFYSGFGYEIAIGDFNGDGMEDLIVGAPFYREPGISGAIYIYLNSKTMFTQRPIKITSRPMKDSECVQLNCHDARFGFAVTAAGDLDQDGYQDFVVGAPFEGDGAIYVFRGSPTGQFKSFSQRIAAAEVAGTSGRLKSFGYSLAGGTDVDNNTYSDLTVGAFLSDTVVLLRTRPIVNLISTIESEPKQIDPKKANCFDGKPFNCLKITSCLRFTAKPYERFQGTLKVNYSLEAEKFTGAKVIRTFFGSSSDSFFINGQITLKDQKLQSFECFSQTAYILPNVRDFLSPISFRLTYQLPDSRPPTVLPGNQIPDFYSYPILNKTTSSKEFQVGFVKNCGQDDICNSSLKLSAKILDLSQESGHYLLKVGEDPELRLSISVTNDGEDAHETTLTVTLPDNLNLIGTDSEDKDVSCTPNENTLHCNIGNPVSEKQTVSVVIRLNPNKISSSQTMINIAMNTSTTSYEKDTSDDHFDLAIKVVTIVDLSVIGSSDPKDVYFYKTDVSYGKSMTDEEEIGPQIKHKFEVKNVGKAAVHLSDLTITWPFQITDADNQRLFLLYIMENPQVEGNTRDLEGARCHIDENYVNPLKLKVKNSDKPESIVGREETIPPRKRRKRTIEAGISDLICGKSSSLTCIPITCKVLELQPGESVLVSIRARLWNRTIAKVYSDASETQLRSAAKISIDVTGTNIKEKKTTNDVAEASTKLISSKFKPREVALWIIIVSVLAGIIILVLLILLLWKVGFFKRRKTELLLEEHRAEVQKSTDNLTEEHQSTPSSPPPKE